MFDSKDHKPKSLDAEKENSSSLSLEQAEVAQLVEFESLSHLSKPSTGLNLIQQKADAFSEITNLELLQKKASTKGVYGQSSAGVIQAKGLPKNLQTGVENLSGQAMNDVNVHYNSKKPEKMGAHAFAQGTDIHLGKGQEKHLPHEAWHVVQQKEGRVKPTVQKKEKIPVNDDASLEKEADVMGDKALSLGKQEPEHPQDSVIEFPQKTVQKVEDEENQQEESEQESEEKVSENENKAEASDANSEGEDNKDQDSSAQVEIKPETLVLSGTKGLYAKVSSFFGKETSFGVLQNLIKEYENTEDDVVKEELKPKIVGACDTWLKKHPEPKKSESRFGKLKSGFNNLIGKTKNDDKKRQSIALIKKRFSETEKASDIKLTTLADKESIGSKIKGVFGFKTTFKQIEEQYHEYQSETSSIADFGSLVGVLGKAKNIYGLIEDWKENHKDDEKEKLDALTKIQDGILNLFFEANYKNIISIKVSKLSGAELKNNKIALETLELVVKLDGKTITGKGEHIAVTSKGVDFDEISIDYSDSLEISEGFEVKNPKLVVSHQNENYSINAQGALFLDLKIPNLSMNTQGNVEVTYNTKDSKFSSPSLSNATVSASMFNDILQIHAAGIEYENGIFKAKNGNVALTNFNLTSDISDLTFSKNGGVDWSTIEINVENEIKAGDVIKLTSPKAVVQGKSDNYKYDISGNLGVNVPLPEGFDLEASGDVSISGSPVDNSYALSVDGNGALKLTVGDLIQAKAEGVNYDKSKELLTASNASVSLTLFQNQKSAELKSLSVSKKDGIDWELATFDFGEVGVDGLLSAKQVVASVGGKKDKYEKKASGVLDLNPNLVPGATINAEGIGVSMNVKDGKWSFGLNGDSLSINLFKNRLKLSSTKLKYENKKFTMETLNAILSLPTGNNVGFEGENVSIVNGIIDWDQLKFPFKNPLPKLGPLEFETGDAILKGKNDDYALGLDLSSNFNSDQINWLKASGKASLLWNYQNEDLPEVTDYDLNIKGKSPQIPDAFLPPGIWPISFSLAMPFPAGPVPMEAEISFSASAGIGLDLEGSLSKVGDATDVSASGTGVSKVEISIKGSVGVGSSYLVKLAGFIKGAAEATAGLTLGLDGKLNKEFKFISLEGAYSVDADFIAKLSAGIEAKALVVFQKTLYELTLKKWELGNSKKEGKFDFIGNKEKENTTTGLFKGKELSKEDIQAPPEVEHNTKEYLQAIGKFNEILKEGNPSVKEDEAGQDALFDNKMITSKKERLVHVLEGIIEENLSNKEFITYTKKIGEDEAKLKAKEKKHTEKMVRQYEKLEKAKKGKYISIKAKFRTDNVAHYTNKIEDLKEQYKTKVQSDLDTLMEYTKKASIYQNQINVATTYISNIDAILENSELSLSTIDQQIEEYKTINEQAQKQKYAIENYLTDQEFANTEVDYGKEDD